MAFSKVGLKFPCGSKKLREGDMVPTMAQVARTDGLSLLVDAAIIRSAWLPDLVHTT